MAACHGAALRFQCAAGGTRVLGKQFADARQVCHGFGSSGRFFVFVGPGQRLLLDRAHRR